MAAREVAKVMQPFYQSEPEIILGCIIVSGSPDTAIVLRAQPYLIHGIDLSEEELLAICFSLRCWKLQGETARGGSE
jgi:hypothetical protein